MITAPLNTESQELRLEDIGHQKKSRRMTRFTRPSGTSYEPHPFGVMARINEPYQLWFEVLEQHPSNILNVKEFEAIEATYKALVDSLLGSFPPNTLSDYSTERLSALEQSCNFRNRSQVIKFLENDPLLISILQDASEQIKNYFDPSTQIYLEVISDPEIEGHQELALFINTKLSPEEALRRLEQFDEGWWLDASFSAREKICIDVEFE
jgi:hypothetical protein